MAYSWEHPSDWLGDKIDAYANAKNLNELRALANHLMSKLDEDDIQDLFQPEMDADGYFDEVKP